LHDVDGRQGLNSLSPITTLPKIIAELTEPVSGSVQLDVETLEITVNPFINRRSMPSVAVILGSAFQDSLPATLNLIPKTLETPWGSQELFELPAEKTESGEAAYLLFRHGVPHRLLPNQINYRAQAMALKQTGCGALLVTSSVGVMDPELPLFQPMLLSDLLMPENRLPDGSACTMFTEPSPDQGHLVLNEGLFSQELNAQLRELGGASVCQAEREIVFAYVGGPRTKTKAENRFLPKLGAQVNSMTLAPEVVLANELEIPCAGLVIGHKYSVPDIKNPGSGQELSQTLESTKTATEELIVRFLKRGQAVTFGNQIFRFDE